uniref:Uncharacterized protein n=1 Tax=Oryza nivara TaxID=4536 RepID=A0A0E0H4B6_ORYNI
MGPHESNADSFWLTGCVEILPIAMAMAILPLSRTLLTSAAMAILPLARTLLTSAMAILPLARTSLTSQRGWRLGAVQPESVHQPRCDGMTMPLAV